MQEIVPLILTVVGALLGSSTLDFLASALGLSRSRNTEKVEQELVEDVVDALQEHDSSAASDRKLPTGQKVDRKQEPWVEEMARQLSLFGSDLRSESLRVARRAKADVPGVKHVRIAADRVGILRQRGAVLADISLAVGAIVLGGVVAYYVNLNTGGTSKNGSAVYVGLAFGVGMGLFVGACVAKWRSR